MTESEYRDFLAFLFERYVRPRMGRVRRRYRRHFEDELSHHLDQAVRSAQLIRFLEAHCMDDGEVYRTFTLDRLKSVVSETRYSAEFGNRLTDEAGFLEAIEAHMREIASGLAVEHLPEADQNVLRETGSPNSKMELRGLVYRARSRLEKCDPQFREISLRKELHYAEQHLSEADANFQALLKAEKEEEENSEKPPKKSRRWFKGVGQIAQGSALSIADCALAIGALNLPVSPETATWGAIASVATGVGTFLNGIGDLRNE
jgi:hypothetical protein